MAETIQQWVNRQKARGVSRKDIASGFKAAYGVDIRTLDADEDYDAFKAKHLVGPPAPPPVVDPAFKPPGTLPDVDVGLAGALLPVEPKKHIEPEVGGFAAVGKLAAARGLTRPVDLPGRLPPAIVRDLAKAKPKLEEEAKGQELEGPFGKALTLPAKLAGAAESLFTIAKPYLAGMPTMTAGGMPIREMPMPTAAQKAKMQAESEERTKPARELMKGERHQRQLPDEGMSWANTSQFLGNALKDLGVVVGGIAEFANELGGITVVPKGETLGQAQERGFRQGQELGGGAVGSTVGALEGLKWGEGLYTHPFTTLLTLEPAFGTLKNTGAWEGVVAAKRIASDRVAKPLVKMALEKLPPVGWVDEAGLPMWPKRVVAEVQRVFGEGIEQADRRMASILDGLMHGAESSRSALRNLAEGVARQMAEGKAKPVMPQLERVELGLIPAAESKVAAAAQAEAAKAAEVARKAAAKAEQAEVAATPERPIPPEPEAPAQPALSPETAIVPVPPERQAVFAKAEQIKQAVARALNLSAAGGSAAAVEMIARIRRSPADAADAILAMSRKAAEKLDQGRQEVLFEEIAPTAADAAREIPVVEATIEPTAAEIAAKGLAETLAQESVEAAATAAEAARQAETAGMLPQVEAGAVNVPPQRAVMGGGFPEDGLTVENVRKAFGASLEVAEATVAIADAMGLDKSKIRVVKGGTPGAGALEQGARGKWVEDVTASAAEFHPTDAPDEYLYHVTSKPRVKKITTEGFQPTARKTIQGGAHQQWSKNRVFLTERAGVPFWVERVEQHLFDASDNPPKVAVVRVRRSLVEGLKPDEWGTADAGSPAYYTTKAIVPPAPEPKVLFQSSRSAPSPLGLYDNILRSLESWQTKGTPEQLLAHLAKSKGTAAQADWIGLREWLKDKKAVTREEVARFVGDNKVDVREVRPKEDRYRGYSTEGGADYHELLLTLPEKIEGASNQTAATIIRSQHAAELGAAETRLTAARRRLLEEGGYQKASEAVVREADEAHAALSELHDKLRKKLKDPRYVGENYRSGHWDQPNVLAHIRAQTFTDAAGRKILFLEEVQSDWHQTGRREGYKTKEPQAIATLRANVDAAREKAAQAKAAMDQAWVDAGGAWTPKYAELAKESNAKTHALWDANSALRYAIEDAGLLDGATVPNAPFKGRAWPELALKRMLAYASEHGFDGIAWTTGEMQAKRYSLENSEGMRGFYDRELPSIANDIAKKFGQRTGKTTIEGVGDVPFLATPKALRDAVMAEGLPLFQAGGTKGAVEFLADGRALIRALANPDASTGVHELAHIARRWVLNEEGGFTPEQVKHAEDWAGAKGGVWDVAAEEKFARGFERYLRDGLAPTATLAKVFAKFKEWLSKIYSTLTGSAIDLQISPEMRAVYDALVQRGPVDGAKRLVARADLAVQQGQRLDLHDLLPEVPKTRRLAIEEAATEAAKAKRDALAAGFGLDRKPALKPATTSRDAAAKAAAKAASAADLAKWLAKNDLPADANVYQIGRKVADYMLGRNIDASVEGLAQVLRDLGVPDRAAPAAAAFLMAEAELGQRAKMIDLSYGAPRRPTAEVERFGVTPEGGLIQHPERLQMAADRAAVDAPAGPRLRGQQTFYEMASRQLPEEAPKPARTDNPAVNRAIDEIARVVKDAYYPKQKTPQFERSASPIELEVGLPAPDVFVRQMDQGLKELTPERIGQRVLEAFDDDSTQTLRHDKIRKAAVDLVRERAQKAGMAAPAIRKMLAEWMVQLESPHRQSAISKSRFPELSAPDGSPLFTRKDMATINAKAAPKVKAEVLRSIVDSMAEAAFGTQTLRDLSAELYRFMTGPDGTPNLAAIGTVGRYASALVDRVLDQGEVYPMAMPYSGTRVASELRRLAGETDDAARAVKLERLADWAARYTPATETGGLAKHVGAWWKDLMQGTHPPPQMLNVHVEPNALSALNAHFAALSSSESPGWLGLIRALGQHTKKMVVAANVPTLVINNIANTIVQGIRRADPMQPVKVVQALAAYKAFKDGRFGSVDPRLVRIFRALDQTDMLAHTELSADIGKTDLGRHMEAAMPTAGTARRKLSVSTRGISDIPPALWSQVTDGLAQAYTKLGDTPFRLEEALNAYDAFEGKVRELGPGEWLELNHGGGRKVRVERTGTGYTIADVSGPHANRRISFTEAEGLQSQAMTKALAQAANVAQEAVFFDYNRIGTLGKYLRGGPLSLLSGIFAWFFKAVDIPFVKKGIVREMMAAPYEVATNSSNVLAQQAAANLSLALRRQAVVAAAQSATVAQRQAEDLRRATGYNPAELGMMLKFATNPARLGPDMDPQRVWTRNVAPVVSSQPTSAVLGGLQYLATKMAYGDVLADPAATLAALQPDAALSDPQRKAKKMLMQMARGEQLSPQQLVQMFGLGGGPLLTLLERIKNANRRGQSVTPHEITMEFAKMMLGATPVKALDVAAAGVGEATGDRGSFPATWSSYGKTFARQGFHGGQPADDESGFLRWALRQMVGAGYALVPLETTTNVETGRRAEGALERYLDQAQAAAKSVLVAEAKRRANIAARDLADDPENRGLQQMHQDAVNRVLNIEAVIKNEFAAYKDVLRGQAKGLALDKLR